MNKRLDLTKIGGLFFTQDTLNFMQDSFYDSLNAMGVYVGEKFVISGCAEAGNNVADGYIVVNGERMRFIGGLNTGTVIIEETINDEGFNDGTLKPVYYTKQAKFGNAGGFPYTDIKRLPFATNSVGECATAMSRIIKSIVQFEAEVILEGCIVSNVNTGASTLDISAGLVLFNGKIVTTPLYSGTYPAYLTEAGGWDVNVPGAGLYIKFDPYTSQRYKNVLDRALIPVGRIIMEETLSDRFDVNGIGKWEMKGYSLVTSLQNRVALGYWFDGVPVANVSDAVNQVPGNQGGEKKHQLVENELPIITPKIKGSYTQGDYQGGSNDFFRSRASNPLADTSGILGSFGGDQEHENRQPFTVVVYAKRTA